MSKAADPVARYIVKANDSPKGGTEVYSHETRFAEFDDDGHPANIWWRKHGQYMMAGGGRTQFIWACRGWIAHEQFAAGVEVTGDSLHETPGEPVARSCNWPHSGECQGVSADCIAANRCLKNLHESVAQPVAGGEPNQMPTKEKPLTSACIVNLHEDCPGGGPSMDSSGLRGPYTDCSCRCHDTPVKPEPAAGQGAEQFWEKWCYQDQGWADGESLRSRMMRFAEDYAAQRKCVFCAQALEISQALQKQLDDAAHVTKGLEARLAALCMEFKPENEDVQALIHSIVQLSGTEDGLRVLRAKLYTEKLLQAAEARNLELMGERDLAEKRADENWQIVEEKAAKVKELMGELERARAEAKEQRDHDREMKRRLFADQQAAETRLAEAEKALQTPQEKK